MKCGFIFETALYVMVINWMINILPIAILIVGFIFREPTWFWSPRRSRVCGYCKEYGATLRTIEPSTVVWERCFLGVVWVRRGFEQLGMRPANERLRYCVKKRLSLARCKPRISHVIIKVVGLYRISNPRIESSIGGIHYVIETIFQMLSRPWI